MPGMRGSVGKGSAARAGTKPEAAAARKEKSHPQRRALAPPALSSDLLVFGWRAGSPCGNLVRLLELLKSISLIYLGDYSVLLGRNGVQRRWRRFNPRDKRKPWERLIAGLCVLCSVAAHVTAAMPSAQQAPALHNSPASHVAVRMGACGLFMRKLPLGRAQVTGYLTPQTDFCSLVLLPFLFLPPGCGR